jgi:hypothetical protein
MEDGLRESAVASAECVISPRGCIRFHFTFVCVRFVDPLPVQDVFHQFDRVAGLIRQWPAESFCGGELSRGPTGVGVCPELKKQAYRPPSAVEPLQQTSGLFRRSCAIEKDFSPVRDPIDEHAGFDVPQPARERIIPRQSSDETIPRNRHTPSVRPQNGQRLFVARWAKTLGNPHCFGSSCVSNVVLSGRAYNGSGAAKQ